MTETNTKTEGATAAKADFAANAANVYSDNKPTAQQQIKASLETAEADRKLRTEPADIGPAAQTTLEASGAFIEPGAKKLIDVNSPAVDNNPRENTTAVQNRVDFNDPTATSQQAVEQRLADQA